MVQITQGIVVVPTHGFANRLRFMAAVLYMFQGRAPAFFVDWKSDKHFACDGPGSLFAAPPAGYKSWIRTDAYSKGKCLCYGDRVHMAEVLQRLQHDHNTYDFLVVIGGHQPLFRQENPTALLRWLRRKRAFYSRGIRWSPGVLRVAQSILGSVGPAAATAADIVAVHARVISKTFDAPDVQANPGLMDFNANSPPERFLELVLSLQKDTPVLLFSNNKGMSQWLERSCKAKGRGLIYHASTAASAPSEIPDRLSNDGIVRAVGEFVAMSRCGMILGSAMSSFSDEASFVRAIPKVLVLRAGDRALYNRMLAGYHANNLCQTPYGLLCLNPGPALTQFMDKIP